MSIIGFLFLLLGLLFLYLCFRGYAQQKRLVFMIAIYFSFFGLLLMCADILFKEADKFRVMGVGIGGMFIGYVCNKLYSLYRCRLKIEGVYMGYETISGRNGVRMYIPIFAYTYQGQSYQQQAFETFSERYIDIHFTVGEPHTIYVDEHNLQRIVVIRQLKLFDVFMLLLGILFVIAPFFIT